MPHDGGMTQPGPLAPPRKGSAGLIVLIVAIVALGLLALAALAASAQFAARTVEMNRLLTAIEKSEAAMEETQTQVIDAIKPYSSGNMTSSDRQVLMDKLSKVAAQGSEQIAAAGVGVADVRILPWDTRVKDAQRAYLAHNQAWVAYLDAAAKDPQELFKPQDRVNATFEAARRPLELAVPWFDPTGERARVDRIYKEGSALADGGSGNSGGQPA